MHVESIALSALKPWPKNPRQGTADVADLVASIKAEGLLQPLVVAKNAEGYYVIAGNRRLKAMQQIAGDQAQAYDVPCNVLPAELADDDKLLEIALAENAVRLDMHPLDECEAFAKLAGEGKDLAGIAAAFNVSERFVRQRLLLAALPDKAREMYRAGQMQYRDAVELARLNDPKAVTRALKRGKEWGGDYGRAARSLLNDERRFYVRHARFDVAASGLKTAEDLFEALDDGTPVGPYFTDYAKAVMLQGQWLAQHIIDLRKAGEHAFVEILGKGQYFWNTWRDADAKEKKSVGLVFEVLASGELKERRAVRLADERKRQDTADAKAEKARKAKKAAKAAKTGVVDVDELSHAFRMDVAELHRAALMRFLAKSPKVFAEHFDKLVSFAYESDNASSEEVRKARDTVVEALMNDGTLAALLATHITPFKAEKLFTKLKAELDLGAIDWPRSMLERLPRPYVEAELKALKLEGKPTAKKGELVELVWKNRPKGWVPAFAKI